MDIVEQLEQLSVRRQDLVVVSKAMEEIENLRQAMVEIVYLIGKPVCRQDIMDIAKPYAIQQLKLRGDQPHIYCMVGDE